MVWQQGNSYTLVLHVVTSIVMSVQPRSRNNDSQTIIDVLNWTESSQAMEAYIIVKGFQQAEEKYGLRYIRFIGDGDSSVYEHIQEAVPVWGCHVTKLECANHSC